MRAVRHTPDEQYQMIMECRNSGLSEYQWCTDHGINPGTFYNWVKRLRKKACYDIPPAAMYVRHAVPEKQDVVKLEILPEKPVQVTEQKGQIILPDQGMIPVMEISCGAATIRITNDIAPQLLSQILCAAGGLPC